MESQLAKKERRDYAKMIANVCYSSLIELTSLTECHALPYKMRPEPRIVACEMTWVTLMSQNQMLECST